MIGKKVELDGAKHIVASSGGNAGLAAAYTSSQLDLNATILVPSTTSQMVINKLKYKFCLTNKMLNLYIKLYYDELLMCY